MIDRIDKKIVLFIISSLLLGGFFVLWATARGIGVTWDGVYYIRGAREIISKHLYSSSHFPPLTSIFVALGSFLNPQLLIPARCIYVFIFCVSIFCFDLLLLKATQSLILCIVSVSIFITSLSIFPLYIEITSEAFFFMFLLLSLMFFLLYVEKKRSLWLVVSAISAGCTFLARYAGAVVVATFIALLLLDVNVSFKKRIVRSCFFLCLSAFFPLIYLIGNITRTSQITSRTIEFHPPKLYEMRALYENLLEWIFPDRIVGAISPVIGLMIILGVVIGIFVILLIIFRRNWGSDIARLMLLYSSIFIALYVPFLAIAKIFFDQDIDFNTRQLAPVFVALLFILINFAHIARLRLRIKNKVLPIVLCIYFLCLNLYPFYVSLIGFHSQGIGYANLTWQKSATLQYVRQNLVGQNVITNQPLIIELYSQNTIYEIPNKFLFTNQERMQNPNLSEDIKKIQALVSQHKAITVWFGNETQSSGYIIPEDIYKIPFQLINFPDGSIYR
jgi:hypothetical protein